MPIHVILTHSSNYLWKEVGLCISYLDVVGFVPCMANLVQIIYPMGDMGTKDQCRFLNIHIHNVFHNLK
jgi:hypothetical protein